MELRQQVKIRLAEVGLPLAVVTRREGLDYGRVQRVLGGYCQPRPGEIEELMAAIDEIAAMQSAAQTPSSCRPGGAT